MNRQQKTDFVKSFHQSLRDAPMIVVAGYVGTSVNRLNHVRRTLEPQGVTLRVVKNTLARRALEGTGLEELEPHFTGMTAVACTGEDAIAGAKAIKEALAKQDTVQVRAGFFEGQFLDAAGVKAVADLPSREELFATMLRTIQEPARQVLGVLQAPARDLLYLLKNYENKLNEADNA